MTATTDPPSPDPPSPDTAVHLINIVDGLTDSADLHIEVSVRESGRVILFHSLPFTRTINWFELNLTTRALTLMLDDGTACPLGLPVTEKVTKHMHNAHQILIVHMDLATGQPGAAHYIPLILHAE